MIYPPAAELLERFSKELFLKENDVVLIGGTAIAYHLKHRTSFDLDFVFPFCKHLPALEFLKSYNAKPLPFDQITIDMAVDEGGDIDKYHKRFSIDGVKVDFMVNPSSNLYESEILKKGQGISFNALHIASLETLFVLKSLLLLDRNKVRDLYDIVYLIEYGGFSPKKIVETIQKYRITYTDEDIINLIAAKKPDELDIETEGIMSAKMQTTDFWELKEKLLKALMKS